jgi:hypothetical protein
MLFRFGPAHHAIGWLLTLLGLVALLVGGRGYITGAAVSARLAHGRTYRSRNWDSTRALGKSLSSGLESPRAAANPRMQPPDRMGRDVPRGRRPPVSAAKEA